MNVINRNGRRYKVESRFRPSRESGKTDSDGNPYPYPKANKNWQNRELFLEQLSLVERYVKYIGSFTLSKKKQDCIIGKHKNIGTGYFTMNNIIWEDSLYHYIEKHNVKPSDTFIDYIFRFKYPLSRLNKGSEIFTEIVRRKDKEYLKLDKNHILIMDALMIHGGYSKKYMDSNDPSVIRFSEHAGLLDFEKTGLEKIIISGKTNIVSKYDDEIFMPDNIDAFMDYEYMFHTHPPTPLPGSRIPDGILYEFPSINDFFHFQEHYNDGRIQGSIIVAPEGMYIIRRYSDKTNKIRINEKKFFKEAMDHINNLQDEAIDKYYQGDHVMNNFHPDVSSDRYFIDKLNVLLNKYDLHVDYYHRIKVKDKWIIDTVYLPVDLSKGSPRRSK